MLSNFSNAARLHINLGVASTTMFGNGVLRTENAIARQLNPETYQQHMKQNYVLAIPVFALSMLIIPIRLILVTTNPFGFILLVLAISSVIFLITRVRLIHVPLVVYKNARIRQTIWLKMIVMNGSSRKTGKNGVPGWRRTTIFAQVYNS
jgi:uncharacterized membrane protein